MLIESQKTPCQILIPEGITLPFRVATAGDRIVAFVFDFFIISAATFAIVFLAYISMLSGSGEVAVAFGLIAAFFLRNFYFIFFELKWSGVTLGKRKLKLRVIARDGGPLTADMIVVRNMTRDLEVFLPLTALMAPRTLFSEESGWGAVIGVVWLLVFMLLPLFSKYRLRCGDLIAGTVVVVEPSSPLLPDLAEKRTTRTPSETQAETETEYTFTVRQLDSYGIHELQVLEDIVRKHEMGQVSLESLELVCNKIKKRIDWPRSEWNVDTRRFLNDFYKAQRAQLERKLLFGKRKERKSTKPADPP